LNIKFKPTHIFNGSALLPTGQVLILNPQGVVQDIVAASEAGENVQELDGWLCPGFVNAHCHIELSHLRGKIAKHTGLPGFVEQVINGRTAELDTIEDAMEAAANELYESGTVAVGDICNTTHSIRLKLNSPLYWHNFIEVSGFVDANARVRLGTSQAVLDVFKAAGFERGSYAFLIDGITAGWMAVQTLRRKYPDVFIHFHRAAHGAFTRPENPFGFKGGAL
jgi:cytosine/adenosine deaminase-related metal-dependent hydrolase